MMSLPPSSLYSSSQWRLLFLIFISSLLFIAGNAQTAPPSPRTNPVEATAVEAILRNLNATMKWNVTSDICSGRAIDNTEFDDPAVNPLIKCDCSDNAGTVCHVTQLKIYALSKRGHIPDELRNLTYLVKIKLDQNYLTGPLPSFLGELTNMQSLSFGINALSGTIPKEIGNLENLKLLAFGSNNFSGPLPSELGNLINLEELYIDSSGVGGEIPPTFVKLQKLRIIWASDNHFMGKIPDFIGAFTNLRDLRLHGNSLQGPIPLSFVNLTKLQNLMIGDITSGSSSMNFVKDMKSLTRLVLRNAKISGAVPSSIGEIASLNYLDLSFNNLSGPLPASLFNMNNLVILFLGNNSFSGGLPLLKSGSLRTIDLSYNSLEGDFPSWISEQDLQLNLVANKFVINDSRNSGYKEGLECLQKTIPCFRGSPIWYNFAINCGGRRTVTASDQLVYEEDNENVTAASYYVSSPRRWAVSSIGTFIDSPNGTSYVEFSSSQFTNTLDSELFQSSRLSPSSLRYYGLGLENGGYTVKLQFAETKFPDPPNWRSVGRRVFDIYVQGNLVVKDFDIRKEAGGVSNTVLVKEFTTNVTDSFLEVHLFWAGKGTCCIPTQGYHGPLISALSVKPNFIPSVSNQLPGSKSPKKRYMALVIGMVVGMVTLLFLLACGVSMWRKKKKGINRNDEDVELMDLDIKSKIFSYAELKTATEDFNAANKLGEGGFGVVYKGKLHDGRTVAVKQLSVTSDHGKKQFVAEVDTLTTVLHRNLVKLYGCCFEGNKRLLVYEYLEHKSLDQALFGSNELRLDWQARFNICLGVARGLAYLHEESGSRIVHRDVKASNVLLDGDLNPKISDFGLAKLFDDKKTHISTKIAGTIGYLAPEYAMRGRLTEKADIFSFGVLALEIVSGRPNTDSSLNEATMYLLEWVWHLHENSLELELVDPKLKSYDREEALRIINVALVCTQSSPSLRPSMSKVINMLMGDTPVGEVTTKPAYITDWHFNDVTTSSYTSNFSSSTSGDQRSNRTGNSSAEKSWSGPSSSTMEAHETFHGAVGDVR